MVTLRRHKPKKSAVQSLILSSAAILEGARVKEVFNMAQYSSPVNSTMRRLPNRVVPARPQCTHILMDRVYQPDAICSLCHSYPALGIVYKCRQDDHQGQTEVSYPLSLLSLNVGGSEGAVKPAEASQKTLREELTDIGLGETVIKGAEAGQYTPAQIRILKEDKIQVNEFMADAINRRDGQRMSGEVKRADSANAGPSGQPVLSVNANSSMPRAAPNDVLPMPRSSSSRYSTFQQRRASGACDLISCVNCRYYFRDRIYMSFEDVFSGKVAPISPDAELRVLDATILRDMDWTKGNGGDSPSRHHDTYVPSDDSGLTSSSFFYDYSEADEEFDLTSYELERTRSKSTTDLATESDESIDRTGRRRSFRNPLGIKQGNGSISSIVTEPATGSTNVETAGEIAYRQKQAESNIQYGYHSSPSSSTMGAPTPKWQDAMESLFKLNNKSAGVDGAGLAPLPSPLTCRPPYAEEEPPSPKTESDCSSPSNEVEVKGGVALTEEAVETQTPDIITQV